MFQPEIERWRVMVSEEIRRSPSKPSGLCESLILAIIAGESGGDPNAEGPDEVGLMQVVYYVDDSPDGWRHTRPTREALLNTRFNIRTGIEILLRRYSAWESWCNAVLAYNTGSRGALTASEAEKAYAREIMSLTLGDLRSRFHSMYPCAVSAGIQPKSPLTGSNVISGEELCRSGRTVQGGLDVHVGGNGWKVALLVAVVGGTLYTLSEQ